MTTAVFLAVLLGQAADNPFAAPQNVAEPDRIALTPKLDGKLEEEEWDSFASSGGNSVSFQWEPGRIHAGASMPLSHELVVSLDLRGDGWLIGDDNLELRLGWSDGKPALKARWMNASEAAGPKWIDAP